MRGALLATFRKTYAKSQVVEMVDLIFYVAETALCRGAAVSRMHR